jgi:hypothetical protein
MVLTRSQTKLQLEKEMMLIENELQLDKVTQNQNLLEEKAFIDNMRQMLNEFETKREGDMTEKMQFVIQIFEYNNRMLQKLHKFDQPRSIKRFTKYIKCVYDKSVEFQREHTNGRYNELQYKLVCDFLQTIKNCQELIFSNLINQ